MQKIAVIGMSCLFPGAQHPDQFIRNLNQRIESISEHTIKQMGADPDLYYSFKKGTPDRYYSTKGGYIQDFSFDPKGYLLPEELLREFDDVFQWSLYVSKEALKDGGYLEKRDLLSRCGVILGNLSFPTKLSNRLFLPLYHKTVELSLKRLLQRDDFLLTDLPSLKKTDYINSRISGYPSTIISDALGLGGIHFSLDAACASSLFSVKLACDYLQTGRADLMLAGAVSAGDPFFVNQGFSTFTAYSEKGISCPLDKKTEGLISGEGAGMFLLKRLDDALRDNDRIYALISSIGVSNDGKGRSVLSPNAKGQYLAYQRAYEKTDILPGQVSYIECHATGTGLGDAVEMESLDSFFGRYNAHPAIGSVKSNFGHLLTCAGMASMIKIVLSMAQSEIPPTINISDPMTSPGGVISEEQVAAKPYPWPTREPRKIAAINAFGFGGTNAHLIFEQRESYDQGEKTSIEKSKKSPLAIVGMDACFGEFEDLASFDHALYSGKQTFIPLPENRWKGMDSAQPLLEAFGIKDRKALRGGFVSKIDFDVMHYKIPPNEVDAMLPQQLLILRVADNALRDSRVKPGSNVGVIIAMETDKTLHQFRGRIDLDLKIEDALSNAGITLSNEEKATLKALAKESIRKPVGVNEYTSFIGNIMASRIASLWDFSGPALTVSSEESSVFKSLEIAELLLESGEVDAMLVGAVDFAGNAEDVLVRQQLLTPLNTGTPSFGLNRDTAGWMIGEGAGAVVLKTRENAEKERERTYALVDAIAVLQGQEVESACKYALEKAGVSPEDIGYLEVVGRPDFENRECEGLKNAYTSDSAHYCALGSVSANTGNSSVASGIASLIKTALALFHRYIPAIPGWKEPEGGDAWENGPFYMETLSRPWFLSENSKRYAAINCLSSDSSVAHIVLSEESRPSKRTTSRQSFSCPLLFSVDGNDASELDRALKALEKDIHRSDDLYLTACRYYHENQGRQNRRFTVSIVGSDKATCLAEIQKASDSIVNTLESGRAWFSPAGSYFTPYPLYRDNNLALVYPGAFNSYIGMGRDVFRLFPDLYDLVPTYSGAGDALFWEKLVFPRTSGAKSAEELERFQSSLDRDPVPNFETGINHAIVNTALLKGAFSIEPAYAFGYSMGEVSMPFALGIWENTDYLRDKLHEYPLFRDRLAGPMNAAREAWGMKQVKSDRYSNIWACYTVTAPPSEIREVLKKQKRVYLLLINSPNEVIIGGALEDCNKLVETLDYGFSPTQLHDVIHCDIVKSEYRSIVDMHHIPVAEPPQIRLYSAAEYSQSAVTSDTLAANVADIFCKTVDFPKLVKSVYDEGARIFLEVGPKSNCERWISETLNTDGKEHLAVSIDRKGNDTFKTLIRALARLKSHHVPVDLSVIYRRDEEESVKLRKRQRVITVGGARIDDYLSQHVAPVVDDYLSEHVAPVIDDLPDASKAGFKDDVADQAPEEGGERVEEISPPAAADSPPARSFGSMEVPENIQQASGYRLNSISSSHFAFLTARKASLQHLREMIRLQIMLKSGSSAEAGEEQTQQLEALSEQRKPFAGDPYLYPETRKPVPSKRIIWAEDDLLEFAGGSIAKVFGPEYAVIDTYKYRVRLPLPPYLLVNRVTDLSAVKGEFKPSSLTTEYDVAKDAWFCVDGQIPWAIASEAGQCDLLLISYLGIDFSSRGKRYYRLTDYTMTFFDELPKEGDTLRYEIKIESFMKFGEALFFNFGYECFVEDRLVYRMSGGRAGFTTDEELAQGKGIVFSRAEEQYRASIAKKHFAPLLTCRKTFFSRDELLNITNGDVASCFGPAYDQKGLNPSLRFASGEIMMLDRIVSIDQNGGPWGLGEIVAEKELAPDNWYFPCHFKDDNVLAGTLVTEGCVQLLGFYMLYLGLQVKTRDARFQPIKERPYVIRARGQIVPTDTQYSYKMEVMEIGLEPRPYARANFYIIMNDRIIVDFRDLGVELVEKQPSDPAYRGLEKVDSGTARGLGEVVSETAPLYGEETITEFAVGSLEKVFGPEFRIYQNRKGPRTPNGDFQLISRILDIKGTRFDFSQPSELISEYDVPADAWFFQQNSYPVAPYSIIMEIALQPCAFLSACMGTTLLYPEAEMCFRNLSSDAELLQNIDLRGKTVLAKTTMMNVSKAAETVVINFEYDLSVDGVTFYRGPTQFGYFTPEALSMQKGLDRGALNPPWYEEKGLAPDQSVEVDLHAAHTRKRFFEGTPDKPCYRLAGGQLEFLDRAFIFPDQGAFGKGYIFATKAVDPTDWFYPCHFCNDPVMPGSLGVEAILQAMRIHALYLDLGSAMASPHFTHVPGKTQWLYRGQITPDNETMDLEVHIKSIKSEKGRIIVKADANLWKNRLRIYHVTNAAIAIAGAEI